MIFKPDSQIVVDSVVVVTADVMHHDFLRCNS